MMASSFSSPFLTGSSLMGSETMGLLDDLLGEEEEEDS
jgi:hypothetical protein